jgi:hypothetical protein
MTTKERSAIELFMCVIPLNLYIEYAHMTWTIAHYVTKFVLTLWEVCHTILLPTIRGSCAFTIDFCFDNLNSRMTC